MTFCEEKNRTIMSQEAKNVIKEALNALGKKHLAFIAHANSYPSIYGKNTGFGTSNSLAAKNLIDFLAGLFTDLQLGPCGKTKSIDASPYTGTIFSNNPLFIDLEQLVTEDWCNLLSSKTYNEVVNNNPNKDINKTAYSYIFAAQDKALKEVYANYKAKQPKAMVKDFEAYKQKNSFWLEKDSLYEALIIEHGNDYWPMWDSDMDKRLFNPKNDAEKVEFLNRIKDLKEKYADEIECYSLCQYIINVQNEASKKYALSKGLKMIADRQVAFSDRDIWAYQSLFLEGWMLGCPPDYFSEDGQAWGFPVLDPEKLFNSDDTLGEGGKLMKALYVKMFTENPGGVRIDHMVGLIDPWVYKAGNKPKIEEGAGRLYSSPEHPILSRYAVARMENINDEVEADKEERIVNLDKDQVRKYGRFVEKIVIAAAEEVGLSKDAIVCEDLGTLTGPVVAVMEEYKLQGMKLTQFVVPDKPMHPYRCANITPKSWAMVGTHDNEPISMWANAQINTHEGYLHAKNLAKDLWGNLPEGEQEQIAVELTKNSDFLFETKMTELFACASENIQIFFTDFFGLYDVYNRPGTSGDSNWSLRIPDNYEETYYNNLSNGRALNLPKIIRMAMLVRGSEFAQKNKDIIDKLSNLIA